MASWRSSLRTAYESYVSNNLAPKADLPNNHITVYPFLTALPASSYVDVMLNEVSILDTDKLILS